MKIRFAKEFTKQYRRIDNKIQNAIDIRLQIFSKNPFDPILNNHHLTGSYKGYRSINITGDWRVIYSQSEDDNGEIEIIFKTLGTHSQLYK